MGDLAEEVVRCLAFANFE